jgi:raffinose/stachyose/melibiose transport system substrate-binding protein
MVKSQVEDSKKDGTTYGLPLAVEGFGLVYNKDMFQKAGVDPASIKTMDDLVAASQKIAKVEGVKKPLAFSKETYFTFMQPYNWPFAVISDYKGTIEKVKKGELKLKDIPEVKQFTEGLKKLMPYTNLALDSYDEAVAGFAQGQYAMVHQGNWAQGVLDNYKDSIKFQYGMIPMPINGNGLAVGNTNYFHVNKYATEAQQKGAIAFMDWLLTDKAGQKYVTDEFKLIPAYSGFDTSNLSPLSQEVSKYASDGNTVPWTFGLFPAGIDKDGTSAMQKFYAGKSTVDQLLDELSGYFVKAAGN